MEVEIGEKNRVRVFLSQLKEMLFVGIAQLYFRGSSFRQQVDDVHRSVLTVQIFEMLFERRLGCVETSSNLHLGRNQRRVLFPKHRDGAADLREGEHLVAVVVDQLRLDKIGDVPVVVDASHVEPRACSFPGLFGDDGDFRASAIDGGVQCFCKPTDDGGEEVVVV